MISGAIGGDTILNVVIDVVVPVFGIVVLGYGLARAGLFGEGPTRGLSRFVFDVAIPLLLFRTMATTVLPDPLPWNLLAAFYTGAGVIWIAGMVVAYFVFGAGRAERAIFGFGSAFSNTVLLGVPVVLTAFGERASVPLFLILAFHPPILFTAASVLLERARATDGAGSAVFIDSLKGMATNPILMGLLIGLLWNAADWPIPGPIDRIAELLGSAAVPCALFALGATLVRYRLRGSLGRAAVMSALKLVVHPALVVFLGVLVFDVDRFWIAVATVMASMPVGVNVYLFADRYEAEVGAASSAVVLSTGLAIFTVSVVLMLIGPG